MQIVIIDAQTGNKFTLATGNGSRAVNTNPLVPTQIYGPVRIGINCGIDVQEDEVIRGLSKVFADRLNNSTRFTFDTEITHDTIAHAEQFILDHRQQVPRYGTLVITTTNDGGVITRYINGCGIQSIDLKQSGVGTFQSYVIIGPAIGSKQTALN